MTTPLALAEELIDLARALATERHLETVLDGVVGAALRLTRAEAGCVLALDRAGRSLGVVCAHAESGVPEPSFDRPIEVFRDGHHFNLDDPNVYAMVTGRIVNVADVYAPSTLDFRLVHTFDRRVGYATRSLVVVPLWSTEGATLGVLQVFNPRAATDGTVGPLPAELERPLGSFSAFATVAIGNARLFEDNRQLIRQLDRRAAELSEENTRLRRVRSEAPAGIIGDSPALRHALDMARRAATSKVAVLLLGETGTGKEVFSRAIHEASERAGRPFVAQNCAALPETLLESELFGHRRGAFSGAVADKKGLVHEAAGGTLFLDEIGDMPVPLQVKLLRLLEDGIVRRVGDTKGQSVDIRIVAATNADLPTRIGAGTFREDLFYRLNVFPISLPPLRERTGDVPLLIDHFLANAARSHGRPLPTLTDRALDALVNWPFPGNVRELKNVIERALLLLDEGERIDLKHLPAGFGYHTQRREAVGGVIASLVDGMGLKASLRTYEARVIEARLREAGWNQSRAAGLLQISRRSLVEKVQRYALRLPDGVPRDWSKDDQAGA